MAEDRLEQALQEMKAEDVDVRAIEAARARVWENMTNVSSATCAEFRQDFPAYLRKELSDNRRLLVEDHLSRCPGCRARIAEMKGERTVIAMPQRSSSRWMRWGGLAAAAALLLSPLFKLISSICTVSFSCSSCTICFSSAESSINNSFCCFTLPFFFSVQPKTSNSSSASVNKMALLYLIRWLHPLLALSFVLPGTAKTSRL